jgi:hypothetical protein
LHLRGPIKVEGLVDCKVRGGSRPLGRMRTSPTARGFLMFADCRRFCPPLDVVLPRGKYVHWVRPNRNSTGVRASGRSHRGGWEVRWRHISGRRRARPFASEDAARAFDDALGEGQPPPHAARTPPAAAAAAASTRIARPRQRWRFVYRRSDGTQTSKRGFTSERTARDVRRCWSSRLSAASCDIPGRRSAATGSAGWQGGSPTSSPEPGPLRNQRPQAAAAGVRQPIPG